MLCAGVTAWHAVVSEGRVTAGQTVLVQGTGGVSMFALQFARLHGARVIVTSSRDDKLRRALASLGASGRRQLSSPTRDFGDKATVRVLTGRQGVDLVVEVGGARGR